MSALARTLRRRDREKKRRASGIDIESIRVGEEELLMDVVPSEIFEPSEAQAPPVEAPAIMPGKSVRLQIRRRAGGFAGGLELRFWFMDMSAPPDAVTLDAVSSYPFSMPSYPFSGRPLGARVTELAVRPALRTMQALCLAGLKSGWLEPGQKDVVEWSAARRVKLVNIETKPEWLKASSKRRRAAPCRRAR